jgi:ABC-three component (ABC-3C) system Middle Component 8
MLQPFKHLDLDLSVLRIAAIVLRELQRRRLLAFEGVRAVVVRRVGQDGELSLLAALNLLYLLGCLEYHVKTDSFEFRPPEARHAA